MEVAKGYKQTEVGVIPEDWEVVIADNVCLKIQDGTHFSPVVGGRDYMYITSKNVKFGYLNLKSVEYIDSFQHKSIYKRCDVREGDILLTKDGANTGNVALNTIEEEISLLSSVAFLRVDSKICSSLFLAQEMLGELGQKQMKGLMSGNAITRLTLHKIRNYKFPLPPLTEQQAIARVLSDTDALIQALEQKIAKKKLIKQGAMQELLRPKEGWEDVRLQECLIGSPSYGINAPSVPLNYNLPAYLRITDITEDGRLSNDARVSVDSPLCNHYFIKEGDIVFARTGASVGKTYLHNAGNGELVYAGFLIKVSVNREMLLSEYLQYYTQSKDYWDWVQVMSQRSGQPGINGVEFGSMSLPKPPTIEEQEVICETLGSIDKEIHSLAIRNTKYQTLKQALMQQLLTGKVRLV